MKKYLMALALCCAAYSAQAMKITNLDTVPHTVQLVTSGSTLTRSIAPDETTYFSGSSDGMLSLLSAPAPSEAKGGEVQSQGILANIIGVRHNQNISASQRDDYVIWPGGELVLQHRRMYFRTN